MTSGIPWKGLHRCSGLEGTTLMKSLPRDTRRGTAVMSWGCTGNRGWLQVAGRVGFKAGTEGNRPLQDGNSEHFVSGAGCDGMCIAHV